MLAIVGAGQGDAGGSLLHLIFKPLTTLLVIAYAWRRGGEGSPYRRAVLLGLGLSLVGDVALMWAGGFLAGLVAFLLAHLAYLVAFSRGVKLAKPAAPWLAYGAVGAAMLAWLWPGLPAGMGLPVAVYVCALAAMAAQAGCAAASPVLRGTPLATLARWAAWGGALFMLSDALLAIDRFRMPLPARSVMVLASYWAAQWLIASSLPPRGR